MNQLLLRRSFGRGFGAALPVALLCGMGGCGEDSGSDPAAMGGEAGSMGGAQNRGGQASAGKGNGGASPSGGNTSGGASSGGTSATKGGGAGQGTSGGSGGEAGAEGGGAGADPGGAGGASGGAASGGMGEPGGAGASGGTGEPWDGCPTADDYAGEESWPHVVEVTSDAVFCALFNEARTIQQELAAKAQIRVAPGTYRLPDESVEGVALPVCAKFGEDGAPVGVAPDVTGYVLSEFNGRATHRHTIDEIVPDPERLLSLDLTVETASGEVPAFTIDGRAPDLADPTVPAFTGMLCPSLEAGCYPDLLFTACSDEQWTLHRHEVTLDVGEVTFELQIGMSFASTEPGAFVRASGTYEGEDFDQENYFRLVYNPSHHHFERHFAVLFDEPIAGACGLEVLGLEPFEDEYTLDEAYAVDCALERLETLEVVGHEATQTPP